MGWKDKKRGLFPGKELRIKGGKEQKSHSLTEVTGLKGLWNPHSGSPSTGKEKE